jgi:hypothetical protein
LLDGLDWFNRLYRGFRRISGSGRGGWRRGLFLRDDVCAAEAEQQYQQYR